MKGGLIDGSEDARAADCLDAKLVLGYMYAPLLEEAEGALALGQSQLHHGPYCDDQLHLSSA